MNILNPVKISYKNLMAAKFRSFLTILGVIIGVTSVIMIMSIGLSAQALIVDQVQGIGSNLIGIMPGASSENGPPAAVMGISITTLKYDDLKALQKKRNVPEIESVSGYVLGVATASYGKENLNASFTGVTSGYPDVEKTKVEKGRFFNESEEVNLSRVIVLGNSIAKDIFGQTNPVNKKIEIDNHKFTVIGVLEKKGSSGFGMSNQDDTVFIPLKTAQKLLLGIDHLGFIRVKVKSKEVINSAIDNIKTTLREQHNIKDPVNDDFTVRDQASAVEVIDTITDILRYFLLAIGGISLVVGGVGIMNIMLIAVSERIREVGLRKAVGAKNGDIKLQFLIESVTISFLGGFVGIIFGIVFSLIISVVVQSLGYNWPFIVSFWSIIIAVVVSILIGVIFGLYPARKASKTSPMEALRYE